MRKTENVEVEECYHNPTSGALLAIYLHGPWKACEQSFRGHGAVDLVGP